MPTSSAWFHRVCQTVPTAEQELMVMALSGGQVGVRSSSGRRTPSCDKYYYLGWNVMGYQFEKPACYCQFCGYALETISYATKVIASSSLGMEYIDQLRFKCNKAYVELEVVLDILNASSR